MLEDEMIHFLRQSVRKNICPGNHIFYAFSWILKTLPGAVNILLYCIMYYIVMPANFSFTGNLTLSDSDYSSTVL